MIDKALQERLDALEAAPAVEPDETDLAMIEESARLDDGSVVELNAFKKDLDRFSGKLLIRIPKSLHQMIAESAQMEGVSINQYILYKLSH